MKMRQLGFAIVAALIGLLLVRSVPAEAQQLRVAVRPDEGNIVHAYTEKFEERTGIDVSVNYIGWGQIHDKILSILAGGGQGYDVVFIPSANATEFSATNQFASLDNVIPSDKRDRWLQATLDLYTHQGNLIAVPWYSGGAHMVYNKKYLSEAGVDPADIETWQDLLEACRAIKKADVTEYCFIPSSKYPGNWYYNWGTITLAMGGEFLNEQNEPVFHRGAGLEALRVLTEGVQEGLFDPAGKTMDDYETLKAFQAGGNSAFLLDSTWAANQATSPEKSKVAQHAGIMPIPGSSGNKTGGLLYAGGFGVMKSSDNKRAAIDYIKFLTSKEAQMLHAILGSNLPTRVSLFSDPEAKAIQQGWPIYKDLVQQVRQGRFSPSIRWLDALRRTLATAVQDAIAGNKSPEEALEWAAEQVPDMKQ